MTDQASMIDVKHGNMTFGVKHMFVVMFAVAIWLATFQVSNNLGIVLGVSIVPGIATFAAWTFGFNRRRVQPSIMNRCGLVMTLSAVWFVIYLLSIGPVVALVLRTGVGEALSREFYDPLRLLQFHSPVSVYLDPVMDWYTELWGWS